MGNKQKISPKEKAKLLRRVHLGEISRAQAAREAGVRKTTILRWLVQYEVEGVEGFLPYERNRQYSTEER